MRLNIQANTLATVSAVPIMLALEEREKAHAKHGANSIEGCHDDSVMLAIMVEEVGEVAKAMTYDQNIDGLAGELAQVMAVAWAWLDQLYGRDS